MNTIDSDKVKIHHSGDLNGSVSIIVSTTTVISIPSDNTIEVHVPFSLIRTVVFDYLRKEAIGEISTMDDDDFQSVFLGI